jgi:hypothetical protein
MGGGIMPADGEPAWLVLWRHQQSQPRPAPAPAVPRPKPDGPHVPLRMRGQAAAIGIVEPDPWPFDGCVRREPVLDEDTRRVVRKVGWHRCLKCRRPFFSEDVIRLRLCSGAQGCRGDEDRFR